ncbi:MAG TPA: TonB-dependent receptor [Nevskiaceae bacterium]|nr:TonB-dependent receptor [Nevskiaceae bacterium]
MIGRRRREAALAIASLVLCAAGTSLAQDEAAATIAVDPSAAGPGPAVSEASPPEPGVDEIVVTAQKREQRLVEVPINVSSLSAADVEKARVEQVRDVAAFLPNVDIKEQVPGAIPVVTIRGVGLDDFSSTNSPAAGIYVDQVTLSSLALMSFDLYDLERVEVLKGPQGTLYGRNSTAGAINVLTARPGPDFEARLKAGYGNYETTTLEGMLNLPAGETFAVRFAAKWIQQDKGFWKSRRGEDEPSDASLLPIFGGTFPVTAGLLPVLGAGAGLPIPPVSLVSPSSGEPPVRRIGERDVLLGRVRAAWEATDTLRLDLKVEALRQRSELGQPEFFGNYCSAGASPIDPDRCTDALGYSDTDRDPYTGDWRGEFPYDIDQEGVTLLADWDLGWATLSSVTGALQLERFFHIDADATPADEFDFFQGDEVRQMSEELRLAGTGERVDWLAGVFWSHDEVEVSTDGRHQDIVPLEASHIAADQETRSAAAFANLDWHLTQSLTLVTGLRYTRERRAYVGGTDWTVPIPGQIADTFVDDRIRDRNWSWKLGLDFAPTERSLIYGNVSKGVKSGGFFSGVTTSSDQLQPYDPESLVAYEIGVKREGRVRVNASAFHYDYDDVQTFQRSADAPVQLIANVEKARVDGVDLEVAWLATDTWTLQAGAGWLDTRLGGFLGPAGTPIDAGNHLANAPRWTLNTMARVEMPVGARGLGIGAQAAAHYSSAVYKEATNDPLIRADAYWLLDARAWLGVGDRWEVALWGRNLTDEEYVVQGLDVGAFLFGNRNYNAPRTFGLEASVRF